MWLHWSARFNGTMTRLRGGEWVAEVLAHLHVPAAWLALVGRGRRGRLQRLQRAGLVGEEDLGDVRSFHGLQRRQLGPVDHQEHACGVGGAREAVERWMDEGGDHRRAREGNGGQRPALPGSGYLGGVVHAEECGEVLGGAREEPYI